VRLEIDVSESRNEIEQIYRTESARLWRALLGYTGDPEVASDAAAEAFVQALGRDGDLRSPTGWIWTAAFRIAAGMMKRPPTHPLPPRDDVEIPDPVIDLVRLLSRLSENQRVAIVMHDYADRPVSEVAAVLGIANATVYVHLSQGRRRMRAMLEDADA
jgi:RNA polymerase sigma-70 factor (ECF subfamily)